jgi:hypothetical protein
MEEMLIGYSLFPLLRPPGQIVGNTELKNNVFFFFF